MTVRSYSYIVTILFLYNSSLIAAEIPTPVSCRQIVTNTDLPEIVTNPESRDYLTIPYKPKDAKEAGDYGPSEDIFIVHSMSGLNGLLSWKRAFSFYEISVGDKTSTILTMSIPRGSVKSAHGVMDKALTRWVSENHPTAKVVRKDYGYIKVAKGADFTAFVVYDIPGSSIYQMNQYRTSNRLSQSAKYIEKMFMDLLGVGVTFSPPDEVERASFGYR